MQTEDKSDNTKESFHEELHHVESIHEVPHENSVIIMYFNVQCSSRERRYFHTNNQE